MNIVFNGVIIVFVTFKLKKALTAMLIVAAVIALLIVLGRRINEMPSSAVQDDYVLVLDAGHGGRDGGAIAADGSKESDINLAIALKTRALADFVGIKSDMTRESDTDFSENGDYSERKNLLDRADRINSVKNAVLISIHQNKFPGEQVRGAEVMYAPTRNSDTFANLIQDNFVRYLDTENRRVARPAPQELLLTSRIYCTGVLAECGFMSNPEESAKLGSFAYQLKIAEIFIASFLQFATSHTAV